MSGFEQLASPEPQKKYRDVVRKLAENMDRYRLEIGVLALAAAAYAATHQERQKSLDIHDKELQELDPEANPERLRKIIDTLPKNFVEGDVSDIGFVDKRLSVPKHYGQKLAAGEVAAEAAGGGGPEKTIITFWAGSKGETSRQLWGDTFLHEVGHANDWDADHQLDAADRDALKTEVTARVRAENRYRSGYVEAISNPDAAKELADKAKEYWAEIVKAYLAGEYLPQEDEDIVRGFIAQQDPAFDRDQALLRRQAVFVGMEAAQTGRDTAALPRPVRDDLERWMKLRAETVAKTDPALQMEGRKELAQALTRWRDKERGALMPEELAKYFALEEEFFEYRLQNQPGVNLTVKSLAVEGDRMERLHELFGKDVDAAKTELEGIMRRTGAVLGGYDWAVMPPLSEDEYESYESWIVEAARWTTDAPEDSEDEDDGSYDQRKEFTSPH